MEYWFLPTPYLTYDYLSILGFKLTYVSKMEPWCWQLRGTRFLFTYLQNKKSYEYSFLIIGSSHYNGVIMSTMAYQITGVSIVYSSAGHRQHQSSASLAFVRGIHRWPVDSPQKGPVSRKMFPFDDIIMLNRESVRLFGTKLFTEPMLTYC